MPEQTWLVRGSDGAVRRLDGPLTPGELAAHAANAQELLWLDLADPGADELALLGAGMTVHPLALEDLEKRSQRPKLDTYPGQYVVVAYEASPSTSDEAFELGEIHLIAATGVLVSVHWGTSPVIERVRTRIERRVPGVGDSVGSLLYAVLDEVSDGYFPLIDRLSDVIDDLESGIVAGERQTDVLREVLHVKRELLELRRVAAPLRDVANALLRRELDIVEAANLPYYQDLYDHLVRVIDSIDLYRDILAAALDANLAIASNSLNLIVKRLTALTVILMVPTLIAGVYGMNFRSMPELAWPWGYGYALGLMAIAVVGAIWFFRARDWL